MDFCWRDCCCWCCLAPGPTGERWRASGKTTTARAVLSYLSMTLRNHDHLGAVTVEQGPEGDMLVLTDGEGEGAYATRIYLSGGRLVEEFSRADAAPGQGQVQSIGTCSQFDVEQLEDRQLRLRLDAGSVQVHLRSGSEGGQ